MQSLGRLRNNNRGAGSLIGAVFLILILLAGYTFYALETNLTKKYTDVLQEMQQLDQKRNKEKIEFVSVLTTNEDRLNITARNTGSYQAHIIWLGIFDETVAPEAQEYHSLNIYIEPAETVSNIPEEPITLLEGQERTVQLVTELGNTFSFSYPPSAQASLTITGVNGTVTHNPSRWSLLGSTSNVSGSASDLASNDANYTVFRSYYSGSTTDFVDSNTSDVDGGSYKGTHSNFTAQQYGPDSIYDVLTEEDLTNFLVKEGTFAKATATGSQTITGVGFLPKAVIFWWTRQDATGETSNVIIGYGMATNYSGTYQNRGVAFGSLDAGSSSTTRRCRSETYSIIILSSAITSFGATASVTQFNNDGFVLNWNINEARADIIHYIALGGTDLTDARAGTLSLTTGAGTQDITGLGFQPDFAMFLWTHTEAVDSITTHAEIGLGFAASSTKRGALVANSENGRPTMDTWQQQRTDSCILLLTPSTGAQDAIVDFSQFLTDGFRLNKSDPPGAATQIFYLALKGGGYDVGSLDSATVTGDQDVTSVGFQPKMILLATQGRTSSTAIGSTAELSIGVATQADQGLTWFEDTDNLADADNEMETLSTRVIQWRDRTALNTFTLRGSASFSSFLPNGFRINWNNVDSAQRQIIYVAFGAPNYGLDLEVQWTNADYGQENEYLCIKTGTLDAEALGVEAWNGSGWISLISNLASDSWNNVSVSSYLASPIFTIRFKAGTETGDRTQSYWNIDVTLLHVWTTEDGYIAEVEFEGRSNSEDWTRLIWQVDSCWDTDEVAVTLQLYNYTLGAYAPNGDGYINYLSSSTPNTDETKSQTITSNPNDFRNSTGYWKAKIKGTKSNSTQFLMKIDLIELNLTYTTSGNRIPYGAWQWYTIKAIAADGDPMPYAYISIYANGANVTFRNAIDKEPVENPCWARLDANGQYQLEIKSTNPSGETFKLYAVGGVLGKKTITQEAP